MRKTNRFLLCALPLLLAVGCVTSKSKDEAVKNCLTQASQMEKTGDLQGALAQLNQALALDPKSGSALARRGMLKTRLLDEMLEAGPERIGTDLFQRSVKKSSDEKDSSVEACELIKFLASEESNGISGRLISAEWDNWREWPKHLSELGESDLYTLRRISGRDRGQTWGDL